MKVPDENNFDKVHKGVKVLLNLIPCVGGSIAEIFNSIISPPIEKRKNEWMETIVFELQRLEEKQNGIVVELVKNEEFISLLISASIFSYKTHLKEKHMQFKNILVNSISNTVSFDIYMHFLTLVDSMTLSQIAILKFLKENELEIKSENEISKIYDIYNIKTFQKKNIEPSVFWFLLKDLENKGLVFISSDLRSFENQVYQSSFLQLEDNDIVELPFIRVTDLGNSFIKYIEED